MNTQHLIFTVAAIASLTACSGYLQETPASASASGLQVIAEGSFIRSDPAESGAGTVTVTADGSRVTLSVNALNISPGTHGFHIHETGTCTAPDFRSAGGHLNPLGKQHGSLSQGGSHVGDLPNLEIGPKGSGSLSATIAGTPDEVRDWLFDADGSAVVIHANADDYRTDPTGNAGAREACAVLLKPAAGG